jgi:hypothetical protein
MEKGAGWSTRRVLSWHGYGSEYLQGTAEGMEMVMCDWPGFIKEGGHVWLTTGSSLETEFPLPRAFTKNALQKLFFNNGIEMSYDMLYRQEKLDIEMSYDMLYRHEKL